MILLILTKDLFHVYVDNYHVILQISLNQNLPISVEYEVITWLSIGFGLPTITHSYPWRSLWSSILKICMFAFWPCYRNTDNVE